MSINAINARAVQDYVTSRSPFSLDRHLDHNRTTSHLFTKLVRAGNAVACRCCRLCSQTGRDPDHLFMTVYYVADLWKCFVFRYRRRLCSHFLAKHLLCEDVDSGWSRLSRSGLSLRLGGPLQRRVSRDDIIRNALGTTQCDEAHFPLAVKGVFKGLFSDGMQYASPPLPLVLWAEVLTYLAWAPAVPRIRLLNRLNVA